MPRITAEEIERVIEHSAPGQAELFLDFEWLIPVVDGTPWADFKDPLFPTYYLFTAPERFEPLKASNQVGKAFEQNPWSLSLPDGWQRARPAPYLSALESCELVPMPGREIFPRIAQRSEYHEVIVNSGCARYDEPNKNGTLQIATGCVALLARGIDPRPETRVLPARSIAEIHHVMRRIHGVDEWAHQLEYVDGELAAVYEGVDNFRRLRRQAFTPVNPQPDPQAFGEGVSQIMCGGIVAWGMDMHHSTLKSNFHPGTRDGLFEDTPDVLRQIDEVLK
jgi:hypothetical protein